MADTLRDKKVTQSEADKMMRPLELDLTAVFNVMQEQVLDVLAKTGEGVTPESLIRTVERAVSGYVDMDDAEDLVKSLASTEALLRREIIYGDIPIRIEQEVGSIRSGIDSDGNKWKTVFDNAYGYFEATMGTDGDEVDCYLGEFRETDMAYIIHQRDPVTQEYDEDKVMLFFESPEEAKKTYQAHYDRPGMFGGMTEVDINQLRTLLVTRSGSKLTSEGLETEGIFPKLKMLRDMLNDKMGRNSNG